MLPGKDGRGHEHGDLKAVGNALERRAQRHLGLAETDVAAKQAVHRNGALHIAFDLSDRVKLAVGFGVLELRLELLLKLVVGRKGVPLYTLTRSIKGNQLLGYALRRASGLCLGALPLGRTHFRQLGHAFPAAADIFADQIKLVAGNVQAIAACVLNFNIITRNALGCNGLQADVASDAMVGMDNQVAHRQVGIG